MLFAHAFSLCIGLYRHFHRRWQNFRLPHPVFWLGSNQSAENFVTTYWKLGIYEVVTLAEESVSNDGWNVSVAVNIDIFKLL